MDDNDYYKWINKMNNDYDKNMRHKNRIQYIKNNLLAIIDIFNYCSYNNFYNCVM